MASGYEGAVATERLRALLALIILTAVVGCGGSSGGEGGATGTRPDRTSTQEEPSASEGAGAGACQDMPVPGHEATQVRVQGASCTQAAGLAAAAVGNGRQPFEAAGFACEPSDAGSGDTNYVCTQGDARVTFRYGAA